jgi:hypothetical protein
VVSGSSACASVTEGCICHGDVVLPHAVCGSGQPVGGKWEGGISVGVDSGDCVEPRESRREERRLCAKWCRVCWLLFEIWCAVSTRRTSRMSRTEGRPAPTPIPPFVGCSWTDKCHRINPYKYHTVIQVCQIIFYSKYFGI